MILTARKLTEIGEALYGQRWRAPIAKLIDRSERQVRKYETGAAKVPRAARLVIIDALRTKFDEMRELLGEDAIRSSTRNDARNR